VGPLAGSELPGEADPKVTLASVPGLLNVPAMLTRRAIAGLVGAIVSGGPFTSVAASNSKLREPFQSMSDTQDYEAFCREIGRFAQDAVGIAAQARPNSSLDFSPDSLSIVEDILAEAAQYAHETTDEQRKHVAQPFGCYVLEVGRRQFGGKYLWHDQY
jgi:hypothetical protein